jgi:hypothetical protein
MDDEIYMAMFLIIFGVLFLLAIGTAVPAIYTSAKSKKKLPLGLAIGGLVAGLLGLGLLVAMFHSKIDIESSQIALTIAILLIGAGLGISALVVAFALRVDVSFGARKKLTSLPLGEEVMEEETGTGGDDVGTGGDDVVIEAGSPFQQARAVDADIQL